MKVVPKSVGNNSVVNVIMNLFKTRRTGSTFNSWNGKLRIQNDKTIP
jgi:hypothetical protein